MSKREMEETLIGFHAKRGRYVQLSADNLTAKRDGDTYDNGVCFTQKPLMLGNVFQLRIEEMDLKWAGSLRLGVTTINPDSTTLNVVRAATDLFREEFGDFWILSGARLHHGVNEEEYNLNLHNLKVDSRIGIQVTHDGDLMFYVDGMCMGVAACGIPTTKPLYGIFDIYGRTRAISKEALEAEALEDICIKTVNQLIKEEDMDKLSLPKCIINYVKQARMTKS